MSDGERTATYESRLLDEVERERARREARRILDAELYPPAALPEILTLRERLARPRPHTTARIEGWQQMGSRVGISAQFKSGKTRLVNNLLRSLVDGDLFLGRFKVAPIDGAAAVFDTEMSEHTADDWYRQQRIRAADRVIPIPLRGAVASLNLLDRGVRTEWAERLRALGVTYLVLDCLRPVLDVLALDEHRDAGRFLVAFDALLAEAEIPEAALVVHMGHVNERARGDSRIRDWPDVEWRLVRQDDDPASPRFLSAYGRDVEQPEQQLDFDRETGRLTVAGGSRRDATMITGLSAVLDVLADSAPQSGRQIKAALADSELSRDMIDAALSYGVRAGRLVVSAGARRAKLYRPSQCPPVSGECPPDSVSECPVAYIAPDTHTLTDAEVSDRTVRTLNGERIDLHPSAPVEAVADPWRNLPAPPGSGEAATAVVEKLAAKPAARRK